MVLTYFILKHVVFYNPFCVNRALSLVHTKEIVQDYSPKTLKDYEILIKSFENPLNIVIFKRFSKDFMQICSRFHGYYLSYPIWSR